jgi:hypothetical protein
MPWPAGWRGVPNPTGYRAPAGMRVVNATINFTFTYNSDVGKVRTISPPEEFDDKGNIKKHTRGELLALKGDTPAEKKMVGYKSDISEVQNGDVVQVALSVFKTAAAAPKKKGKKGKEDLDEDKEAKDDLDAPKKGRWVVAARFIGKVTRVDTANTDSGTRLTVQVTTQVLQGNGGGNTNANQTIDPEKAQATLILIGQRPRAPADKGP